MIKKIEVHRNIPQLRAQLVDANIEVDLWGRRTGKSVRIAHWLKRRSKQMPRCNLTFLTTNYNHLKKKILPEIKLAWEQMNWFENVHYWVGKYPPKELGIKLPYRLPPPKDAIFTIYGSVIKLASMDKNAPSAGDATDGLVNAVPATNGGTGQAVYTVGDLLYAANTNTLNKLVDVATGNALLRLNATVSMHSALTSSSTPPLIV